MQIAEIHLASIDSTNSYAKTHFSQFGKDKLTCILADEQTAGRGRYNRKWHSPPKANLYLTFVFHLPSSDQIGTIAQVLSLSLAKILTEEGLHPEVKWPNDVLLNNKKLSGILCETQTLDDGIGVILGIGINVNLNRDELANIDKPATSLQVETNREWDRQKLFHKLTAQFLSDLETFKKSGFQPFYSMYERLMAFKGKSIHCFDGKKEWIGICHSISPDGRLNLLLSDQTIHTLSAGDIFHL